MRTALRMLWVGILGCFVVCSCRAPSPAPPSAAEKPVATRGAGSLVGWPQQVLSGHDPDAQARRLASAYLESLSAPSPRPVQWRDSADKAKGRSPQSSAPIVQAQQTIRALLEGATFRRKIEAGPVRAYRFFKDGDKGPTWAIWTTAPCGPVVLRPLDGPVTVTDLAGSAQVRRPREGAVVLTPSEGPIFVTLPTMEIMGVTPIVSVAERPEKVRPGESAQIVVEVWNPFKDLVAATVSAAVPKGWSGPSGEIAVSVEQGTKQRAALKFAVPRAVKAGQETIKIGVKFGPADLSPAEILVPVEVQR